MQEIKVVENKAGWNVSTLELNINLHWVQLGWRVIQITENYIVLEREVSNV